MGEKKLLYRSVEVEIVNILSTDVITTSDEYTQDSGGWT